MKNSVMSVVIAVGPAVSFPDFITAVSGDRLGAATLKRLERFSPQPFARPTMHHSSRDAVIVLVRVAKRIWICTVWPVFSSFSQISTGRQVWYTII